MQDEEKEDGLDISKELSKAPATFTVAAIAAVVIIIPATLWWGIGKITSKNKNKAKED